MWHSGEAFVMQNAKKWPCTEDFMFRATVKAFFEDLNRSRWWTKTSPSQLRVGSFYTANNNGNDRAFFCVFCDKAFHLLSQLISAAIDHYWQHLATTSLYHLSKKITDFNENQPLKKKKPPLRHWGVHLINSRLCFDDFHMSTFKFWDLDFFISGFITLAQVLSFTDIQFLMRSRFNLFFWGCDDLGQLALNYLNRATRKTG